MTIPSIESSKLFINNLQLIAQKKGYLIPVQAGQFKIVTKKPVNFKTKDIGRAAYDCLQQIKISIKLSNEEKLRLIKKLRHGLSQLSLRIESSIKKKCWFCFLKCFGIKLRRPRLIENTLKQSKKLLDVLQIQSTATHPTSTPFQIKWCKTPKALAVARTTPMSAMRFPGEKIKPETPLPYLSDPYILQLHMDSGKELLAVNYEEEEEVFIEALKQIVEITFPDWFEVECSARNLDNVKKTFQKHFTLISEPHSALFKLWPLQPFILPFLSPNTIYFLEVIEEEKKILVPFTSLDRKEFIPYEGSLFAAIAEIAVYDDEQMQLVSQLIDYPEFDFCEFIDFIESAEDEDVSPPIFSFSVAALLAVYQKANKEQIEVYPYIRSNKGKTLFHKWAHKNEPELIQSMLAASPEAILEPSSKAKSFLSFAFLHGHDEVAKIFIETMNNNEMELHPKEIRLQKAAEGSVAHFKDLFAYLSEKEKSRIFRVANIFNQTELVLFLRSEGMFSEEAHKKVPGSPIGPYMDIEHAKHRLSLFWRDIEDEGVLSEEEPADKELWHQSTFSSFMKYRFATERAEHLGLTSFKAPRFQIVHEPADEVSFTITDNYQVESDDLLVFIEKVQATNREWTAQEKMEVSLLSEACGLEENSECIIKLKEGFTLSATHNIKFGTILVEKNDLSDNEAEWNELVRYSRENEINLENIDKTIASAYGTKYWPKIYLLENN